MVYNSSSNLQSEPLVSFVLVAYNQEDFIHEAIVGALSQSYSHLEIVLSDDCSTDRTFEIMEEMFSTYQGPHKLVINRNSHNMGLSNHLNRVFRECSGELIVIAAGDDISLETRAASLYRHWVDNGKPSMVCSQWNTIDRYGRQTANAGSLELPSGLLSAGKSNLSVIRDYLNGKPYAFPGATAAYSKELVSNFPALGKDVVSEDLLLCLRALLTNGVLCVEDKLVCYRQHDSNISKVEGSGAERFRVWSIRNAPTYECFYEDLKFLFDANKLSLFSFASLAAKAKAWVNSAYIMRKWGYASLPTKLLLLSSLLLIGSRRHKKFAINNIFRA